MSGNFFWYATRGAGIASLLMLTGVVVLGILTAVRWQRPGWPRFLSAQLHESISLLSLIFLAIHVAIAAWDPYTSLGWGAVLLPFSVPYRWFWLGLGGVALYLIVAVILTSLLRARLGHRSWRLVHWLTYAAWPIALAHGIGTGSDSSAIWMWLITGACLVVVAAAIVWRLLAADVALSTREAALPPQRMGRTES